MKKQKTIAVVGGGAGGIFGAISAAERDRSAKVIVLEATDVLLDKVRISGGGRCNVTHNCFDTAELIKSYPRGFRELRSVFSRFQPSDTVNWFESRGVQLKAEPDGRMFPISDNSESICNCLIQTAESLGVELRRNCRVKEIRQVSESDISPAFEIEIHGEPNLACERVLIATGSSPQGYRFAESLGHSIVPCVPSLFTFKIEDMRFEGLSGVSFERVALSLQVGERVFYQEGPVLITHWGLSGPAVLKLSAFSARELVENNYHAVLTINFLPLLTEDEIVKQLTAPREKYSRKQVQTDSPFALPRRYWSGIVPQLGIAAEKTWSGLAKEEMRLIAYELMKARFNIVGRGIFKEEFVTCGGVNLKEVDFKTMQSKLCPGLFFAGEILDIDGITGGFNFQSAWSTGWIAGHAMSQ